MKKLFFLELFPAIRFNPRHCFVPQNVMGFPLLSGLDFVN